MYQVQIDVAVLALFSLFVPTAFNNMLVFV